MTFGSFRSRPCHSLGKRTHANRKFRTVEASYLKCDQLWKIVTTHTVHKQWTTQYPVPLIQHDAPISVMYLTSERLQKHNEMLNGSWWICAADIAPGTAANMYWHNLQRVRSSNFQIHGLNSDILCNLMPNTHCRRDETVLSRRRCEHNLQLAHDDCRRILSTIWKLTKQTL